MLILHKCNIQQLITLLYQGKIDELIIPQNEEIAPSFLLEFAIDKLKTDSSNTFWWTPRLIIVNKLIVGMCGFKSPPQQDASIEIGYGIIPSQQKQGLATRAIRLLVEEAFSRVEIQSIFAHTVLSNYASQRVLEKNKFINQVSKIDADDGEILIWQKYKSS